MFSDQEILDIVKKYARTSGGKQAITDYKKTHKLPNPSKFTAEYAKPNKSGHYVKTIAELEKIANDLKSIVYKHIVSDTASQDRLGLSELNESVIIVGDVQISGDTATVQLYFDKSQLHRDSLQSEWFDGIDDIIKLFVTGYDARRGVFGPWDSQGVEVWSLMHRDSNDFLERAVNEFNRKYSEKAVAAVDPYYQSQ